MQRRFGARLCAAHPGEPFIHYPGRNEPYDTGGFFNNMVLVLDQYFVHRLRKNEGKDANALQEVRAIAKSLMEGDRGAIRMTAGEYRRLSDAFLAEIESRYS